MSDPEKIMRENARWTTVILKLCTDGKNLGSGQYVFQSTTWAFPKSASTYAKSII